jgi:hypothetical protein
MSSTPVAVSTGHFLADNLTRDSWIASAAFPGPSVIAGAVAVVVAVCMASSLIAAASPTPWVMCEAPAVSRRAPGRSAGSGPRDRPRPG